MPVPKTPVLMTADHPRINEFLDRLASREGIDLTRDFDLAAEHLGSCHGKAKWPRARSILSGMGLSASEIEQSLVYFQITGLQCDCAVLFGILTAEAPYEFKIASYRKVVSSLA